MAISSQFQAKRSLGICNFFKHGFDPIWQFVQQERKRKVGGGGCGKTKIGHKQKVGPRTQF